MSDIQQRIADILGGLYADTRGAYVLTLDEAAQLAEVLVSELGLAQEWAVDRGSGNPVSRERRDWCLGRVNYLKERGISSEVATRYVTEWVPELESHIKKAET